MASRSRFYVDTPHDTTQRHSMFVNHSELEQRQHASASATLPSALPSAAGSVDRLTGLEEKKSSRFFTLKPKSSFSLRPLFSSSSSLISLSPSKKRKAPAKKRDSFSQTEQSRPEIGEVGVQTLNASTVDVPVQTSLEAWEEGDAYRLKRIAYGSSPYWSRSVSSGALTTPSGSKIVPKDPLASPKLVKYAAPSKKTAALHPSALSAVDVNNGQSPAVRSSSVENFPEKGLANTAVTSPVAPHGVKNEEDKADLDKSSALTTASCDRAPKSSIVSSYDNLPPSSGNEVSSDLKYSPKILDTPVSAIKSERTDSPSKRSRSVHFDLPAAETPKPKVDINQLRNVDKEFDALLKNLNILTEEPGGNDLRLDFSCPPRSNFEPKSPLLSPSLKSAIDVLRQDFLAPIPETCSECTENNIDAVVQTKPESNENSVDCELALGETKLESKSEECDLIPESPAVSKTEDENSAQIVANLVDPASLPIFTSSSGVEVSCSGGNVYNSVIYEENPAKTVPLPTLPSFFEATSNLFTPSSSEVVESAKSEVSDTNSEISQSAEMPFNSDAGRSRLSRSSSRSSVQSNSKQSLDPFGESMNRYDSCENLDQLEEEIIRDLYSPEDKYEETILKSIDLPPSDAFQNSGTTATHMRRVILDQLLSGKKVEDIVPSRSLYQRINSDPGTRHLPKQPKKYKAVLTKMDTSSYDENLTKENEPVTSKIFCDKFAKPVSAPEPPKMALVTKLNLSNNVTPENTTLEITETNRFPPVLEVRRSSWTPNTTTNKSENGNIDAETEISPPKDRQSNKSVKCDFTNCLKPSKIQNSPFIANLNRSMSPSPSPHLPSNSTSVAAKQNENPPKIVETVGECDYANCLKPSQVHNSLFKAELSEITANKPITRSPSPMTLRRSIPTKSTPDPEQTSTKSEQNTKDAVIHKSELIITLHNANKSLDSGKENPAAIDQATSNTENEHRSNHNSSNDSIAADKTSEVTNVAATPPPPPPPPPPPSKYPINTNNSGMKSNNTVSLTVTTDNDSRSFPKEITATELNPTINKTPVMAELEKRLEEQSKTHTEKTFADDKSENNCDATCSENALLKANRFEINLNGPSVSPSTCKIQNGNSTHFEQKDHHSSSLSNGRNENHFTDTKSFSPKTVITSEPPPPGAVLLDQKVIVDGDKVHTDKYYALPIKEVLKEKTSTTKFIPAPPKYEGIGPTEDGVPTGLRNSVKKENMHNWYKTMFKSLHKADSPDDSQEYIIGYTSEPESNKKDIMMRKKPSTMDYRSKTDANSNLKQNYPPAAKSSIEIYNIRPRLIEDYEPGHSSVTDDETHVVSRRHLHPVNVPKPSYEFKNGYESDTSIVKKPNKPEAFTSDQQKMWYKEIQRGGDIPQFGLGKSAPERPKEPIIGPLPPPPLNYSGPTIHQVSRPSTLPTDYLNQNGNGYCQQMNGAYEMHMRQAIHSEMQQRMSPSSNQLSPPNRNLVKSPSKSPDLRIPARVLFDFKAESPKEISLRKSDMVLILRQLDKNWYEVEHKGLVGIFPISYVEIVPPEHASTPVKVKSEGMGRTLYDFVAQTSIELTVRKGDTITLVRRVDANWYEGIFNGKKGIIPVSYIQVLQEPLDKSTGSLSPSSYASSPRSVSETRENHSNIGSISPSRNFSPPPSTTASSVPVTNERKLSKKGSNLIEPVMYRALYSYTPQNSDELELQEGDSVCVVEMCDDGWYVGTSVRTGIFGIFPGNYVEKC